MNGHGLPLLAALLAMATPALANDPAQKEAKKGSDPNEVVCEKIPVIGSRLAAKRVCQTRAEWDEQRRLQRQEVDRVQTQRGSCDGCQ